MAIPDQIQLITRKEAAAQLRVSPKTVYRMGKAGILTAVALSRKIVRYDQRDVLKLIKNAS